MKECDDGIAGDSTDLGPYQVRVDVLRKDGKPIFQLVIVGRHVKRMRGGTIKMHLRTLHVDPEWR